LLRKRRLTKKRFDQIGCQPDNPVSYFDEVATLEFFRLKVLRRWQEIGRSSRATGRKAHKRLELSAKAAK
jgi:hypothetical protein